MHCDICNIPAGYDDATFSVVGEGWAICTYCFDSADREQQVKWEDAVRAEQHLATETLVYCVCGKRLASFSARCGCGSSAVTTQEVYSATGIAVPSLADIANAEFYRKHPHAF